MGCSKGKSRKILPSLRGVNPAVKGLCHGQAMHFFSGVAAYGIFILCSTITKINVATMERGQVVYGRLEDFAGTNLERFIT
jgi:hypothetical protein